MTVFVTTHYMDEAEYCDRLALIYRGELIAQGTPEELKHEAMQEDVLEVRLRAAGGGHGGAGRAAVGEGSGPVRQEPARGGRRRRAGGRGRPPAAGRAGASQSQRIEQIVPSLEDVFVSLIEARDRAEQPQEEVRR